MAQRKWRSFLTARAFVRSLGLLGSTDWYAYARGELARFAGVRPPDIPFNPAREYREVGWQGVRDWLGPPPVEPAEPGYLDFRKARNFARSLGLRNDRQWRSWCAGKRKDLPTRPWNVPIDPKTIYPRVFRGWDDWLGVPRPNPRSRTANLRARQYRDFEEARAFARGLLLQNNQEWRDFCRGERSKLGALPDDIPAQPDMAYASLGWKGYGDWLGTDARSSWHSPALAFAEAREIARRLRLKSLTEFLEWARGERPDLPARSKLMPTNPHRTYADEGWAGWGDFLGTGNVYRGDFRPFVEVRTFARSLGLGSVLEWREYAAGRRPDLGTRPADIPSSPDAIYPPEEWTNWGDFLGTGRVQQKDFQPFRAARRFVRSLEMKNNREWRAYCRGELREDLGPRPDDIPAAPEVVYAGTGWSGWCDFLGIDERRRKPVMPFEEARAFVRALGLRTRKEWGGWLRGERPDLPEVPELLPRTPESSYVRDGWRGFGDFLGTGNVGSRWRAVRGFQEAREFARALGLRTWTEWQAWSRGDRPDLPPRPKDIPAKPQMRYREFTSWADFLGRSRKPGSLRR